MHKHMCIVQYDKYNEEHEPVTQESVEEGHRVSEGWGHTLGEVRKLKFRVQSPDNQDWCGNNF